MKFNFVCWELTCGMVGGTGPDVPGKGRLLFSGPVGTGGGGGGGNTFLPFCCGWGPVGGLGGLCWPLGGGGPGLTFIWSKIVNVWLIWHAILVVKRNGFYERELGLNSAEPEFLNCNSLYSDLGLCKIVYTYFCRYLQLQLMLKKYLIPCNLKLPSTIFQYFVTVRFANPIIIIQISFVCQQNYLQLLIKIFINLFHFC